MVESYIKSNVESRHVFRFVINPIRRPFPYFGSAHRVLIILSGASSLCTSLSVMILISYIQQESHQLSDSQGVRHDFESRRAKLKTGCAQCRCNWPHFMTSPLVEFTQSYLNNRTSNMTFRITLAPREECEGFAFGSVCLSVCLYVCPGVELKNYRSNWLAFFIQEVLSLWLSPPLRCGSGLENLLKDSSPLRDRTEYAMKSNVRYY